VYGQIAVIEEEPVADSDWFAKYKFLQPIGQGGMGTVFLAEDRSADNATRVIKQMIHKPGDEFERNESVRLFKREADMLRTLNHDGIVKIHDSHVSSDGKYFLVMDYVPGRNLEMIVNSQGGPLSSDNVVSIAIHCCDILEYLHDRPEPIIYRDLKPSNLMLTPEGRVIFIDFGIARLMPKEAATRVVTAGYSPPEQYFGRPEPRSDIYSLGATMSHLLTGVRPKPLTACNPITNNPSVLQSLNNLIRKMTAHEVNDRPPSAQAVKYSLLKIYKEMHPEFEIPDWLDNQPWDEQAAMDDLGRPKAGRNLSTGANMMPNSVGSDEYRSLPGGKSIRMASGQQQMINRSISTGQNPIPQLAPEEPNTLNLLVAKVRRWFDNIGR